MVSFWKELGELLQYKVAKEVEFSFYMGLVRDHTLRIKSSVRGLALRVSKMQEAIACPLKDVAAKGPNKELYS